MLLYLLSINLFYGYAHGLGLDKTHLVGQNRKKECELLVRPTTWLVSFLPLGNLCEYL